MLFGEEDDVFYAEARGLLDGSPDLDHLELTVHGGRARIRLVGDRIQAMMLTKIQTEELSRWLRNKLIEGGADLD